ncbi:hypothetical protein [Heyndrickxia acidicola]|uniref:Integral membrane protein n=1 Tax=Heyndrickxia acidicola TaxID=209389 RepID=A0ABU6MHT6_9BACI|nr:hypothetical protein [Heyndrickxia acidicola]MED1203864.1 hypothetical protein [Heyndrickxia acidicola]
MRGIKLVLLSLAFLLTASFILVKPAWADARNIFNQKETIVPEDQNVENLVVLGDNATINGRVRVSVVVINGNLKINKTADITGPVLVIGGNVEQEKGAHVSEQIISVNMNHQTQDSFILGGMLFLGYWILKLAGSIVIVAITVLAGLLARKRLRAAEEKRNLFINPGRVIVTGLMASLAIGALSFFLTIVVIGIPVVILMLLGVMAAFIAGMVLLSAEMGKRISWVDGKSNWLVELTGSALIVSAFNFPLIGWVIFLIVLWFSLGFSITWVYNRFFNRKKAE